mmetsp:Transcript_37811/g.82959  ORF Transcript_37811/g.82959 Transcript_37811/m.82959 type:complete len:224 (+) Transcript_37811:43-714(+)
MESPDVHNAVNDLLVPIGGQLTFGSTLGFASGVALRLAGRVAAVGVGTTFCIIQGLAYQGYIQVDWRRVERSYIHLLDQDQDGRVTASDFAIMFRQTVDCLAFNLPAGAGFTAGLVYGLGATPKTAMSSAVVAGVGGRLLLSRGVIAAGGLGATSTPAALVGLKRFFSGRSTGGAASAPHGHGPPRPGYCMSHFLGEAEDRCTWNRQRFASSVAKSTGVARTE